ncbi:uncharacterized protein LOC116287140 [Actinia tenebrosa]|uniref:Uncharacterized protein LOC116287140 n=1 Tax=Actinia tenebrosa TaxID=6105 RepID=A0A6P8H1W3_ACTTE|nr:uncharacterized protein LOC116287140 [Actinia tenebrosa]
MSQRSGQSAPQIPSQADESIMTTLRVIMDVLKSHDGSIKQLHKWLDQDSMKTTSPMRGPNILATGNLSEVVPTLPLNEPPVRDGEPLADNIPDDVSEVSSLVSSRTEYKELPSRSTLINSTMSSGGHVDQHMPQYVTGPGIGKTGVTNEYFSTPMRTSLNNGAPTRPSIADDKAKFDISMSSIDADTSGGRDILQSPWQPSSLQQSPSMKTGNRTSLANVSLGVLQTKIQLLENQVSEWSEIMDEMSDRMAKQPSLIRKFAKESTCDKVSQSQHMEDIDILENRLLAKMDERFAHFDRKIIELYDDITTRVEVKSSPKGETQDTAAQFSVELDSLTAQFNEQQNELRVIEKDLNKLDDEVYQVKQDTNMYRHHVTSKRSDEELVSLVAEQLLDREDVTGWKTALKEMHSALNKQSEINSSLHHSFASLDKKMNSLNVTFPHHGRWRWGGVSSVYPKGHSCVNGYHADDISFVAQLINSEPRMFVWERNKPYVVVTTAGCYWITIGAFGLKSNSPPSLQVTVDEEPVSLFNSSGKSPTNHKISVTSSAPKHQASSTRHKWDSSSWRPGSSLSGAIMLPGHSRLSFCAVSTVSGTRLAVEGYLEIHKKY